MLDQRQATWAGNRLRDRNRKHYLQSLADNLFLRGLNEATELEFREADGGELEDAGSRPAKMRALGSSSALAVNFFDPWRNADKRLLSTALRLHSPIRNLRFEYKTQEYPVGPRSPNLDLLLQLEDGSSVGIESKFREPYDSGDGYGALSARYFASSKGHWAANGLHKAQRLATRMQPDWIHLDTPQLLKHLLGLAADPARPSLLLYLWFDTGEADAVLHRRELEAFQEAVAGDAVEFRETSYQSVFQRLTDSPGPVEGWHEYMGMRYFPTVKG